MKPSLVILAAGMGSRFGGMKQTEPIGPNGEFIIDYSVYDAASAGFGKVVFVIRKQFESKFRETIGRRAERVLEVDYAFQELDDMPSGFDLKQAEGRVKPWGTGHAVYCARSAVNGAFAVINADDFYGRQAYQRVGDFLDTQGNSDICMAGYYIKNTLTENGCVSRGLCECDGDGYLIKIDERLNVSRKGDKIVYTQNSTDFEVPENTIASMNFFGFPAGAMKWFENGMRHALSQCRDIMTAEVYLPAMVTDFIKSGLAKARVLETDEKWYGITYSEDLEHTRAAIKQMVKNGRYSERLWDNA